MTLVTVNSCREAAGIDPPGTVCPPSVIISGIYYGERLQVGMGYYSIEVYVGDDKLRLDLLSTVAADSQSPRPLAGTYEFGTLEEPTPNTFFVADDETSPVGTLYWKNGTPMLVTGGEVTVQLGAGGGFVLTIHLKAGDSDIDLYYNGHLRFAPDLPIICPPAEAYADPMFAYVGEYGAGMGMLAIVLTCRDWDRTLQLCMTVPLPDDPEKVEIPTGTFQVVRDPQQPYLIAAGYCDTPVLWYSHELAYREDGFVGEIVSIEEGTVIITRDGANIGIRAHVGGTVLDSYGALSEKVKDIMYRVLPVPAPLYAEDMTRPSSTLAGDVTLENFVNIYIDKEIVSTDSGEVLWRLVFSTENLTVSPASDYDLTRDLTVKGEGRMIAVQCIGGSESPVGTFQMNEDLYEYLPGWTLPGIPGVSDRLGLANGTWYMEAESVGGDCSIVVHAGAMPGKGSVTVTEAEEDGMQSGLLSADIEIYDKYGHRVSGTITFRMPAEQPTVSETGKALFIRVPSNACSSATPYQPYGEGCGSVLYVQPMKWARSLF